MAVFRFFGHVRDDEGPFPELHEVDVLAALSRLFVRLMVTAVVDQPVFHRGLLFLLPIYSAMKSDGTGAMTPTKMKSSSPSFVTPWQVPAGFTMTWPAVTRTS